MKALFARTISCHRSVSSRVARFPNMNAHVFLSVQNTGWFAAAAAAIAIAAAGATVTTMADPGTERSLPQEDMPRLGPTWSRGGGMFKPPKRPQGDSAVDGVSERSRTEEDAQTLIAHA